MDKLTKKGSKRLTKNQIADSLMKLFHNGVDKEYDLKSIYLALRLTTHPAKLLCNDILDDMVMDDYLSVSSGRCYKLAVRTQVMKGMFQRKRNGRNSFLPEGEDKAILVMERNSKTAMNGDLVTATLLAHRRNHTREAEVIDVVKRARETFVGKLKVDNNYAFLITESRTLANDIFIPKDKLKGGKTGDKAVVKVVEWPDGAKNPIGCVVDILGESGDNTTEMHAILAEFGLPYVYPSNVEDAANHISAEISAEEIAKREDFRDVTTFTIDPHDAKDFDDALSIRLLKDGLWEIGVHIADVSHYVTEDSVIDQEAVSRATSIYLVDRTIPMLPERLCNFICSLRPDEEKLAYSTIFKITKEGEIKDWHLAHTVIRSNRRFTYEEVQTILEQNGEASPQDLTQPGEHPELLPPNPDGSPVGEYATELIALDRIAKMFRAKRFANGAIGFDRAEVRFEIDETGKPVSTYFKIAKDANKLVEEYMLLANRSVAEMIGNVPKGKNPKVFPYRIHDVPDPSKLENLQAFITKFGYKLRTDGSKEEVSKALNKLLEEVKGKKEENLVETVALRAMMKARYSIYNIGHYGLMFPFYTHFTSPIRRYPDTMVHRLLTRYAEGGRSASADKYEELCEHSSAMEQLAASAERASIKYKQTEFMAERVGQEFDGTISGVTEFGLYVEVNENKCEGMVPLRDLVDDYYEFDERNYCLFGRRHHKRYSLGDAVKIKVAKANLERKQIDFQLMETDSEVLEKPQLKAVSKKKNRRR
ncbi:MAG: ribonuclease R [Bacteroidaceae bacterium]